VKRRVRGSYVDIAAAVWGSTVGVREDTSVNNLPKVVT